MKVGLLGAAGTIAPAIVRDLADSEEVDSILLLDLRGEVAEQVASEHGGGKAGARQADARRGLAAELAGLDLLVNSASYRVNLDAMGACLEAGCHYLDLGGLYRVTGEQLELDGAFREAGLIAMLGVGSSPGKTNLMAARAVAELEEVESVAVCAAGRDLDPPQGFSLPYALETLIDELTIPPVVLRGGEPAEVEPLSDGGEVDFGDPINRAGTIYTLHSELRTFGGSFGCRECSFRLSLAPALLEELRRLTRAPEEEVRAAAARAVRPSGNTVSVHVIDAAGGGRAVRMRSVTPPHQSWGLGGGIVSTASPAAAAVRLMARGQIEERGALPPERCIDPERMFAELETRGCRFDLDVKEESAR
ncbi:MAG: saccharopine dehydrogenase NADP-binding domain-containing protein [Solirubrobacterales bacterium]